MAEEGKRVFDTRKKTCPVKGHGEYMEKYAVSKRGIAFASPCPRCEEELSGFLSDAALLGKVKLRRMTCPVPGHGEYMERSVTAREGGTITSICPACAAEVRRREPILKICPNNPDHGEYAAHYMAHVRQKTIYATCPECEAERRGKEEAVEAFERNRDIKKMIKACGIPERFKNCNFENYVVEHDGQANAHYVAGRYVEFFLEKGRGEFNLIFYGSYGTGKTHLACAVANKLIREGYSVKYTSVLRVTGEVKGTFKKNSVLSPNDIFAKYASFDLIILDEVGVGQINSEWEHGVLFDLINRRYEKKLPTIVICNLPENPPVGIPPEILLHEHLERNLTKKVVDRLRENCVEDLLFDWQSYRRKKRDFRIT